MRKRLQTDRRSRLKAGFALGLVALALAACASASTPPATDAEKSSAEETYVSCLKRSALSIDDGRGDVASIASEILPLCSSQFAQYQETFGRGLKPEARQAFDATLVEYERDTAEAAVLDERRAKRAPSGQQSN